MIYDFAFFCFTSEVHSSAAKLGKCICTQYTQTKFRRFKCQRGRRPTYLAFPQKEKTKTYNFSFTEHLPCQTPIGKKGGLFPFFKKENLLSLFRPQFPTFRKPQSANYYAAAKRRRKYGKMAEMEEEEEKPNTDGERERERGRHLNFPYVFTFPEKGR